LSEWPYNTLAWRNLRQAKLSAQPLCEPCEMRGRTTLARAVDHIVAIAKGGPAFPPLSGLMAMCEACHNAKTNAVDHPNATGFRRALKGFDLNGNPIDGDGWSA
jgi:5-methylcytosine-specific restriction endonuclease McrA